MAIKSVSALFFIIFLLIGGSTALWAVFKTDTPSVNFLKGQFTDQYEANFDKELGHRPLSINFFNRLNHTVFGEGKKGVLIGTDGWLFTDEEFALDKHYQENIKNNLNYIIDVKNELFKNNIKLFIVPIPSKARLFEDKLGRYQFPKAWHKSYVDLLSFLKAYEIGFTPDLENALSKETLFLKNDTHWTPEGARVTAFKTAYAIENFFPYLTWKTEKFTSKQGEIYLHEGDLNRYTIKKTQPLTLWETTSNTEQDLFSEKEYPVVLVGTSYSANSLWNFEGFLKESLGTDILNMADEGLGPFEVMQNYLKGETYKNYQPKLVIWEIPERYLSMIQKENL